MSKQSQAERLLELFEDWKIDLLCDQFRRAHIRPSASNETLHIRSKEAKSLLSNLFFESEQKIINPRNLNGAIDILEGKAPTIGEKIVVKESMLGNPADQEVKQPIRLIELVHEKDPVLYLDERGEPCIFVTIKGSKENHRLSSSKIKSWMASLLWKNEGQAPSSETISTALLTLRSMAYEGQEIQLYNRVAPDGKGGIYIDMANKNNYIIHVTDQGWKYAPQEFPLFRRYSHQKALPEPVKGGEARELLNYVNITDPIDQMLYLITVGSYFIPDIAHPVLCVHGPQGSGKTMLHELVKFLVDPTLKAPSAIPEKQGDLIQALDHHYLAFFDNVSYLTQEKSDDLCRAVTGGGFSKRKLWTDDEDVIFSFKRCVGLNGINIPAERGDLLERSVSLELTTISKADRRAEMELLSDFESNSQKILGGLLDAIAMTLSIKPQVKLDGLYRMADFTQWGYALATAFGYDADTFLEAYGENLTHGSVDSVSSSIVGDLVKMFMLSQGHKTWEGSAQKLYEHFMNVAKENNLSVHQKMYPKSTNRLTRELNRISADLEKLGYKVSRRRSNGVRLIKIQSGHFKVEGETQTNFEEFTLENDPKGGLASELRMLHGALRKLEREKGDAVSEQELRDAVKSYHWTREHFDELLKMLMGDNSVYMPRPGFYRVSE